MPPSQSNPLFSVVVPVYGCPQALDALCARLVATLSPISEQFEIILVNDACPQGSWQEIERIAAGEERVVGINFSRNFGQHHAITAGLDYSRGDWVVVMDCDLQDLPEDIPRLYQRALEGFDAVKGQRSDRKDGWLKQLGSRIFHALFYYLTEQRTDKSVANYGIYSRRLVNAALELREQHRSFVLFVSWVGFPQTTVEVQHARREHGKTSYNYTKMVNLAIDSIIAYSNKPLRLCIKLGFLMAFLSFLYAFWVVIAYFFFAVIPEGYTSIIVSIYFLSGLIIGSVGMLGLYISKIFNEVKDRPLYVIEKTINLKGACSPGVEN